jgi:SAM-dependent methyltransferase
VQDAEDTWEFSTKFDYIHGRALFTCFTDPKHVLQQAYDALAHGGYLELNDFICPMQYIGAPPTSSAMYKWMEGGLEAAKKSGRSLTNAQYYAQWMREMGFEDVVVKDYYWPSSPWAKGEHYKMVAQIFRQDMTGNIDALSMRTYTRLLGWSPEEVRAFTPLVVKDFYDLRIRAYMPM